MIERRISAIRIGLILLIAGLTVISASAQTVRGFVTAASDREALQGVHVALDNFQGELFGAITNRDGFFLISRIPAGRYELRASFIGFDTFVDTLDLVHDEPLTVNIALRTAAARMDEVLIEAERESGAARITAGMQSVRPEEIELIPSPDISGDLVSYLSTMPGVVLMGDRGGQVFIRGGEPAHNLTLLDGMYVFQPFHVLGFYSAFPSDIVSQADVHAGGFGSKYSGRVSSVIDVQTRNGNKRAVGSAVSLSPFSGSARLEGPLMRDRISFLASARMSLLDQLASQYISAPLPYAFSDLFGKVHAEITRDHRLSISALRTSDRGALGVDNDLLGRNDEIRWANEAYGLRYLVAPRSMPVITEFLVSYSALQSELGSRDRPVRTSRFEIFNVAFNFTNYIGRSEFHWGIFLREPRLDARLGGLFQNVIAHPNRSTNAGGYLEPDLYVGYGLHVRPGFSTQVYGTKGVFLEPRLRVLLDRGGHHWSAAAGLYRQEIVGLSDQRDVTNIFTAWTETPLGEAARAFHTLLGYRTTAARGLDFSAEVFYKKLDNLFIGEWTPFPRFSTRLQQAHGRTAGIDLRLEVSRPQFYGFVNYGLSSTRYETEPQNESQAAPVSFRPPHDRRHQVNLLATFTLRNFDVSLRWQFGSGLPFTQIKGFDGFILMDGAVHVDRVRGFPRVIYDSIPYRAELPTYHRLDVTVDRTFILGRGLEMIAQVGVINAYDRRNLFALDLFTTQRTDQLPIVPIAGLKIEL